MNSRLCESSKGEHGKKKMQALNNKGLYFVLKLLFRKAAVTFVVVASDPEESNPGPIKIHGSCAVDFSGI